jgi:hypothetical protein
MPNSVVVAVLGGMGVFLEELLPEVFLSLWKRREVVTAVQSQG